MKVLKIVFGLFFLSNVYTAKTQGFLKEYFNSNKDSLIKEATRLISTPEPVFKPNQVFNIAPEALKDLGFEQEYKNEGVYFTVRDKKKLFAHHYPKKSNTTILLLHGVASNSYMYNKTAGLLQEATDAEVYALDLRGHGQSYGKAGDVDYINQYADDIVDVISNIKRQKPKGKIIVAGHSMGGGIALNYLLLNKKIKIDGCLLFAPLIGNNTPAIKNTSTSLIDTLEPFMKIAIERIAGLKMLNEIGKHNQDSLAVLFLNLPENLPLRKYSYRANMSMAPEDYKIGLKALKIPTLILIGKNDEAFDADAMKKAVTENCNATIKIVDGATHNGIRHDRIAYTFIKNWFNTL